MSSPAERIAHARAVLVGAGITDEDAALDAEVLARHALGWDRSRLIAHGREPAPAHFGAAYDALVARRVRREPVAQIVGHREFWGLEFDVTRDVLTPRPETELIVDEALDFANERRIESAVDVGTGSGCIAITIAHELPTARVTATDSSDAALAVARRNARRHAVAERITFVLTDLLEQVDGSFDMIVSNPPYVPVQEGATLPVEVREYEPHAALFGGDDGLAVIRRLLQDARSRLSREGRLIIEFGAGQEQHVKEVATAAGWIVLRIRSDLQGIPRTAVLKLGVRS